MKKKQKEKYPTQEIVTKFFKNHEINLADIKAEKLKTIENIYDIMCKYAENPKDTKPPIFNNLMNIISDEKILIIAYNNIKSNSGADTKSIDEITADGASIKKIKEISALLKQNKYKFGRIRQVYVPKPGKGITKWTKKKLIQFGRPLGIPNFHDKIVQEALRIVLTAIFEPLFDKTNSFGFRINYSALDAMMHVEFNSQGMVFALEGDIKNAFGSMDYDILIKSLSQFITDKKFLNLILLCCKSGIFNSLTYSYEFPCIGSPQGAIVSPLLWNIYMYKFDLFIQNDIINLLKIINNKQLIKKSNPNDKRTKDLYRYTTTDPTSSNEYKTFQRKTRSIKDIIINKSHRTPIYRLPIKLQQLLLPLRKQLKQLEKSTNKISSVNLARIKLRILYMRYADDFIIFINSNYKIIQYIKNKIYSFLKYELKLNLSVEKTLITNLRKNPAKFLGFSLTRPKPISSRIKTLESDPSITKLTTGGKISIGIDYDRVLKKLMENKYITQNYKIRSIGELTKKENIEILLRFNEIIMGYTIYYLPVVSNKNFLSYILYILEYSFYKTLCHKNKTTINKLMKQHNNKIGFLKPNLTDPENSKYHTIINHSNLDELIGKTITRIRDNLFSKKEQRIIVKNILMEYKKGFWRTNASMTSACINCGSWQEIEYHHIRKLGNDRKKYKYAFDYNIRALNRKAIPLCAECHMDLHRGLLDTRDLSNTYDYRLAVYQSQVRIITEKSKKVDN